MFRSGGHPPLTKNIREVTSCRRFRRVFASLAVAAALSSPAGAQGVVTKRTFRMAMAQTIANAALAQCQSMGFKVSVAVVDRGGLTIVMLRGDGAGLHTPEGADRKAFTARTFSQPSADFVQAPERPAGYGWLGALYTACWRCPAACRSRSATR